MIEIIMYSRGGQGAVTSSKIMVHAALLEGKYAQSIPSYGQERKGALVRTYARVDHVPIESKSYVYKPDCIIVFDEILFMHPLVQNYNNFHTHLIINSTDTVLLKKWNGAVSYVDASKITSEIIGNVPSNMAMLGAYAKALGCPSVTSFTQAIEKYFGKTAGTKNAKTCEAAFRETKILE